MKRIIALTLTITLLLSTMLIVNAEETLVDSGGCGTNLTWSVDNNGLLTISGSGTMDNYSPYGGDTPWYNYRNIIKSVKVENGITTIDVASFIGLTSLETIYWNPTDCTVRYTYYGFSSLFPFFALSF